MCRRNHRLSIIPPASQVRGGSPPSFDPLIAYSLCIPFAFALLWKTLTYRHFLFVHPYLGAFHLPLLYIRVQLGLQHTSFIRHLFAPHTVTTGGHTYPHTHDVDTNFLFTLTCM